MRKYRPKINKQGTRTTSFYIVLASYIVDTVDFEQVIAHNEETGASGETCLKLRIGQ